MTHPLDEDRHRPIHAEAWWLVRAVLMLTLIAAGIVFAYFRLAACTGMAMLIALALKPNMEEE